MKKITFLFFLTALLFLSEGAKAQVNLLANGGFEEDVNPHSLDPKIHTGVFARPLRVTYFFNTMSEKSFPTSDPAQAIGDNIWFHRTSNNNRWFLFTYVEPKNEASTMSVEVPHSGNNSMALYFATGELKSNCHDFVASLGQRVALDNTKKYNLKFFVQKDEFSWGAGDANKNNAEKINIGIISSDDAAKDYTHYTTYTLPSDGAWTEVNVTFDLPAIIAANPGKSFAKSAIFVSLVPTGFNASNVLLKHQVNLDDFSLTEATGAGVDNLFIEKGVRVENKTLYIENEFSKLSIYDLTGKKVYSSFYRNSDSKSGIKLADGIYIVDVDNVKGKILIR